jgi:hypothetical protein
LLQEKVCQVAEDDLILSKEVGDVTFKDFLDGGSNNFQGEGVAAIAIDEGLPFGGGP